MFRERTEKVTKRLELVNRRYEGLEKRRNLEVQGYKTDIKILRDRLKDLEKRLCKVCYKTMRLVIGEKVFHNTAHMASHFVLQRRGS